MRRFTLWAGALFAAPLHAWYLPGSAPNSFKAGDNVSVQVNALQPMAGATPVHGLVSYDYYDERLHFCRPPNGIQAEHNGLSSELFGDHIFNSALELHMLEAKSCVELCQTQVAPEQAQFINERIRERYAINMMVDGLPVVDVDMTEADGSLRTSSLGFALGSILDARGHVLPTPALYNHYVLNVSYHERSPGEYRVVGVNVRPMSLASLPGTTPGAAARCDVQAPLFLSPNATTRVAYTYSVLWTKSATPWATRWDAYLHVSDARIHWYALLNSTAIVSLLCVLVALIMARAMRRDIYRYNAIDLTEDIQEDYGWKLVHGEVFRAPASPMLLSVCAGAGAQLTAMICVTLVLALLGFLSPANRGSLGTILVVAWSLLGSVSGFVSAKVYASFGGTHWRNVAILSATLVPLSVFVLILVLNAVLLLNKSAGAVPFGALNSLGMFWFLLQAPLSVLGTRLGLRSGGLTHPVRVNKIPRQIPPIAWYLRLWPSALLAGLLPFGAAWLELFFILHSLFSNRVYYAYGFLTLTFLVTALTTATISILSCYCLLCAEDYRWHWRAFFTGGAGAVWFFVYGLFVLVRLNLPDLSSKILFLGYLFLMAALAFLLFGFLGFAACYACVRRLYQHIRVD